MDIFFLMALLAIIAFASIPLLKKSGRTRENKIEVAKAVAMVVIIIILVQIMKVPIFLAAIITIILYILTDKKTYTKKRLIIYGSIIVVIAIAFYMLFKQNPNYTLKHLAKNPETTSLYISLNNEEVVTYQSDIPRPLASVVKIIIALEYAYQIDNGTLSKDKLVSLDDLNLYYLENTDGGAHPAWLEYIEDESNIQNGHVTLHEIAKGMITFSSNANTDYLIDLIGVDKINARIDELELTNHSEVYPIVAALIAAEVYKTEHSDADWFQQLTDMSDEEYQNLALNYSDKMKNKAVDFEALEDLTVKEQRIWSDRLPSASAATYGKLLNQIRSGDFPEEVTEIMQELMEWPMEIVEGNKEIYQSIGAKGGSTAFVLNQAMYIETLDGDQFEIVLLTDDLSLWQSEMLSNHSNSFIVELVNNEEFLEKVQEQLFD